MYLYKIEGIWFSIVILSKFSIFLLKWMDCDTDFYQIFKSRKIIGCFTCTNLCHVPPCKFYKTHCFVLTASTRALSFDTLHQLRFLI